MDNKKEKELLVSKHEQRSLLDARCFNFQASVGAHQGQSVERRALPLAVMPTASVAAEPVQSFSSMNLRPLNMDSLKNVGPADWSCLGVSCSALDQNKHLAEALQFFLKSGVVQWLTYWAHNPKVSGTKPGFAIELFKRRNSSSTGQAQCKVDLTREPRRGFSALCAGPMEREARPRTRRTTEAGSGGKAQEEKVQKTTEEGAEIGKKRKTEQKKQQKEGKNNKRKEKGTYRRTEEEKSNKTKEKKKGKRNKTKEKGKKGQTKKQATKPRKKEQKTRKKRSKHRKKEQFEIKAKQKARKQEQKGTGPQRKQEVDSTQEQPP